MKMICEVSNPHYHPGPEFKMALTKKRDLSVPPHWVANERLEKDGKSYAIVMPPRDKELWEETQEVHIHMPEYIKIKVGDREILAKVKVQKLLDGKSFDPVVHFDHIDAQHYNIKGGETTAEL